ncbi:peroxisomal carnitine O-octanoyltransferase-like isoform X1 [Macrosteles quadrilineatus]|uniref:peroxisomal carnitine O-octanoyltransferase-like isoform X1 n=2 Tax=Macrosteles quadrilineatus TaxID=74068 RepID=UPI0023E1E43A|nr:peroxisomal carnitine O-octanoyltransferase-like isoform X1 [Macrosteles quadrilineatus]
MGNVYFLGTSENLSDFITEMTTAYTLPADENFGTFDYDEDLPSLPVPKLEETIKRYLASVRPFAKNEEEYKKTDKIAIEFMNGEGKALQDKLLQHASRYKNWIEKWWEDYAYLTLREPLIPHYSMTGPHPRIPGFHYGPGQQLKMASVYCHQLVLLWLLLRKERLRPAMTADKKPLSMSQYRRLFNCSVVPGMMKDSIIAQFKTEKEGECPSHVAVLCKGHMFVFNSLTPEGHPLSPADWENQLTEVRQTADLLPPSDLPCLSCDNRTSWAENREHLMKLSPVNISNLSTLDSAMFVICLDDSTPTSASDVAQLLLCGDYSCRWADAALNIVFFSNGLSGGLCAHSPFDGIVSGSAMHFTYSALKESAGQNVNMTSQQLPKPQQLEFVVDSHIRSEIERAMDDQQKEKDKFLISQEEFLTFGKKRIQNSRIHPDSFIQMALQLAYFRLHSRYAPCYETATTRTFYNGRTETVRACSEECVSWVKSMTDPQCNDTIRAKLLLKAIQKHNQLMAEARRGEGCDRHLMGLYCVAVENNLTVPQLFQDQLFKKSGGGGNFTLSTSLLGYSPIGGGVAPMCFDGYGVFYSILPERLIFTISVRKDCQETSSPRLFREISQALNNMIELLERQTVSKL